MAVFNSDEVFEMAVDMERSAAKFYRRAAELHGGKAETAFLTRLAEMEDEHERIFEAMRRELPERPADRGGAFDPYGEGVRYLDALAEGSGAEGSETARASLTGRESLEEILRTGVSLEKQAILFYLGLKDLVIGETGKRNVQKIIDEEKGHVATLMAELKQLTA
ncbi:MAG: ferritin family protein [Lentisphaerae bacterium]|nr:ferritin family protein [Lentisphaerota bacterium]